MYGTNSPAYLSGASATNKKSFVTLTQDEEGEKFFQCRIKLRWEKNFYQLKVIIQGYRPHICTLVIYNLSLQGPIS